VSQPPPLSKIKSREEFDRLLPRTRDAVAAREAAQPAYPVWSLLRAQLDAALGWTRNGRVPTKAERDTFLVGTIAARELEPAMDIPTYELTQALHELQYYLQVHM
jgi:hypothetical protein